jgi:hypothetical protein
MSLLSVDLADISRYLSYDPDTGNFRWLRATSKYSRVAVGSIAGSVDGNGYIVIRFRAVNYRAHRLAWLFAHGFTPRMLDHINRNRTDNRLANLRLATFTQNAANRPGRGPHGKGVVYRPKEGVFHARLAVAGRHFHLGTFRSADEAHAAYCAAAVEHFGEFARFA